jgi:hypothetical protein
MNPFKTFTLKWWQGAAFKWGIFALGIAAGAYWHTVFGSYLPILLVFAAVTLVYVTVAWWKQ